MKLKTRLILQLVLSGIFYYAAGLLVMVNQIIFSFILLILGIDFQYLSIKTFRENQIGIRW